MIASCGAKYIIVGHSERRANFNETNELLEFWNFAKFRNFERVYLLHCCIDSYTFTSELCDFYLDKDEKKEFKGYAYYYSTMLKHAENMTKEIQGADRFYEDLNIEPHHLHPLYIKYYET